MKVSELIYQLQQIPLPAMTDIYVAHMDPHEIRVQFLPIENVFAPGEETPGVMVEHDLENAELDASTTSLIWLGVELF